MGMHKTLLDNDKVGANLSPTEELLASLIIVQNETLAEIMKLRAHADMHNQLLLKHLRDLSKHGSVTLKETLKTVQDNAYSDLRQACDGIDRDTNKSNKVLLDYLKSLAENRHANSEANQ